MNDKLKIFIRDNRHAFDAELPDTHRWKGIERSLDRLQTADALESWVIYNRVMLDTEAPNACVWEHISGSLASGKVEKIDSLACYIRENREAFDDQTPDLLKIWGNIDRTIHTDDITEKPKAKRLSLSWNGGLLRAAASIALLLVGLGAGLWFGRSEASSEQGLALRDLSPKYAEIEDYYSRDIAQKQQKLTTFTGSRQAEVEEDLLHLDQMMNELKQELSKVPPGNREQVVRAMIENYKTKAAILERVLERLEQKENEHDNGKNAQHETENI